MRITRLRLTAYGHFSGFELELGDAAAVHLVLGPNEAGKSTARRGLVSALFGYPHHVEDGYKYDAKDICIGADLLAKDSRLLAFNRRRRGKAALVAPDGTPIDEAQISSFMGGISRDLFVKVFGLSHPALREHAQALVEEGGALGYSLAEAATGISGLRAVVTGLGERRAGLFLPTGSRPTINQRISRLTELNKLARQRALTVSTYARLTTELEGAEHEASSIRDALGSLAADVKRLERVQRNLPRLAQRQQLSAERRDLGGIPILPANAAETRLTADTHMTAAAAIVSREGGTLEVLEARQKSLALDPTILAHKEAVEKLKADRILYLSMMDGLPRREAELAGLHATVRQLLAGAELVGDPAKLDELIPSQVKRSQVRALITEGNELATREATAEESRVTAEQKHIRAESAACAFPQPADTAPLALALQAASALGDVEGLISNRRRRHNAAESALATSIVAMGVADLAALRDVRCPPAATIARYAAEVKSADQAAEQAQRIVDALQAEIAEKTAQREKIERMPDFVSEEELVRTRARRNLGWELVRAIHVDGKTNLDAAAKEISGDRQLADVFAEDLARADRLVDALRRDASADAGYKLLGEELQELQLRHAQAAGVLDSARQRQIAISAEWHGLWAGIAVLPPEEMRDFVARRDKILNEAAALATEEADIASLVDRRDAAASDLRQILAQAREELAAETSLDQLRRAAQRRLDELQKVAQDFERAQAACRAAQQALDDSTAAYQRTQAAITSWLGRWAAALASIGLKADQSTHQAASILETYAQLLVEKGKIDTHNSRLATIQRDMEAFEAASSQLAAALGMAADNDAVVLSLAIEQRLTAAEKVASEAATLTTEIAKHRDELNNANTALEEHKAVIDSLCQHAGCDRDALATAITKSARATELDRRLAEIERDLLSDGGGLDLVALNAECEGQSGDSIMATLATKAAEVPRMEAQLQDAMNLSAQKRAAFQQVMAGDQSVDAVQEAAIVEAQLSTLVQEYSDLTVQEATLRRAIDIYRARNEGPLIGRAKLLFRDLTNGAYAGLRVDLGESNEPVIIAEHSSGRSLEVHELSDGAQDSLYLALRFAVVEEHNATREPIPFIADDLLLNLDDTRAAAAFRVLARVATASQVILFTHHDHMVPLAQANVPTEMLKIHRLSAPPIAAAAE